MRETNYTDPDGRKWMVQLPDGVPDFQANTGISVGPPSLEGMGLPKDFEVTLHNELFFRKIWTSNDVKRRRADVVDAVRSAYKVDSEKIYAHYLKWEERL